MSVRTYTNDHPASMLGVECKKWTKREENACVGTTGVSIQFLIKQK